MKLPIRAGRRTGRTLFDADDNVIGLVDSPEMASEIVDAVNRLDALRRKLEEFIRRAAEDGADDETQANIEWFRDWLDGKQEKPETDTATTQCRARALDGEHYPARCSWCNKPDPATR